ncbi:MAG TPA: tetratricopeptide repeat protein [Candidatus Polarisedimenticolia bacterium]|jgi:Tfp pilus assembly protein PilF|nr:tetratricopeptide repeat protein [Candidatus Polarisedimenticolia bacterium]
MLVKRRGLWIAVVIVALVLGTMTFVPAGRFAVREAQGGAAVPLDPGLHLRLPLYHRVYVYDTAPVTLDGTVDIITRDHASFKLPVRLTGHASPADILTFHQGRSGREPRLYIEERMRDAVVTAAKGFNADELLAPDVARRLAPRVSADLITRGISDDGLSVQSASSQVIFNAVVDYLKRKFPAAARTLAERSLQASPKDALVHAAMGVVLESEGKRAEAEQEYLEAVYLDPMALEPMSRLYVMYQSTREPAKIAKLERLLVASLDKKKDSAIHHDWLGQVYMREGQYEKAKMSFTTAIGLKPQEPEFQVNLGSLLAKQGKMDEGIAAFQKALELRPEHPLALFNLGSTYAMQGQYDRALEFFHRAERVSPPNHTLFNSLAQAYEAKGQHDRAAEYLKRSLAIKPDQADRRDELKRIEARLRKKA